MKETSKEKRWWIGRLAISLFLLAFVVFVVVIMLVNSAKPDRITLGELDSIITITNTTKARMRNEIVNFPIRHLFSLEVSFISYLLLNRAKSARF